MENHGFQRKKVRHQETFAEKLKRLRHEKKLTLHDVEDGTKIRIHHLEHMEAGAFDRLPVAHAKGFIRHYAQFLGINDDAIQAELVHIDGGNHHRSLFTPGSQIKPPRWIVTPRTIGAVVVILICLSVIGYVVYQVKQFAAPPSLIVSQPIDDAVVTTDNLTISGTTDPGATVTVDDLQATVLPTGEFHYAVTLRPGLNQITIRSVNRIKKQAAKTVTILYESGTMPTPTPTSSISPSPK